MKTTLLFCALAANVFASTPILVRVTPQTLAELQMRDPMIRLVSPPEGNSNVVRTGTQSIIHDSTILHDGKNWTLIPKEAVVFLPKAMKSKVNARPVGTLMPWAEFLTKNQSWVTTSDVTFDHAAGNEEIPAGISKAWASQNKIVVAVHHGGPISVRLAESPPALTKR